MEPDDHLNKKKGPKKFFHMEQKKTWRHFCAYMPCLKDQKMGERLVTLIALIPKDNLLQMIFIIIKQCWDKYLSSANCSKHWDNAPDRTVEEVNAVFIDHVQEMVFCLNEPQALTGLLINYKNMFDLCGEEKDYRTLYIKSLFSDEFKEEIGFQNCVQKNESMLVYDRGDGGTFLGPAVNSWWLNIEDLFEKCCLSN